MPEYDSIWINAHLATMTAGATPYGAIPNGAIAARDGAIAWVGSRSALPQPPERLATRVIDAGGRWITPGLIDPHTHLVFGGDRIADFERRVSGESYVAAASGGSGIIYTVAMTRAADEDTLLRHAERRLRTMIANGTTTVEIKSGYGLDVDTELRLLRIARRLGEELGITVRTTYLGAHVVPPEYANRRADYVTFVCETMLPRIAREQLADAVDVFCDTIAFSPDETACILDAARRCGFALKVHADQIADTGAAELAAAYGALSADHCEHTSEAGIAKMASSGTVAVLLPGAYYYLRETVKPRIETFRAHGVPIALATDCNPGTSPILTMPTVLNLACVLFAMTPEESAIAATRNAARALGLTDRGELREGARCDLAIWDIASPAELCYWLGASPCDGVVINGEPRATADSPGLATT